MLDSLRTLLQDTCLEVTSNTLDGSKSRCYGSRSDANWNLGVLVVQDPKTKSLILRYAPALAEYLTRGDEDSLQRGRDLGRLAARSAIRPHQLVLIHAAALLDGEPSANVRESAAPFEFLTQSLIALEEESAALDSLESACAQGPGVGCTPVDAVLTGNEIVATARRRRQFLADLSRRIVDSPDLKADLSIVAELAVPGIAGCSAIHWIDSEGQPITAAVRGSSDQGAPTPWCDGSRCRALVRESFDSRRVIIRSIACGQPLQMTSDDARCGRAVVVPLIADKQVRGALTLCWGGESSDIRFEQEFGKQLACCVQRAFESARYRTIAKDSQEFIDHYIGRAVHDLSTPLATLSVVLEMGLGRLKKGDALNEKMFLRALTQVEQMRTMVKELVDATGETLAKVALAPAETDPPRPKPI